MLLDFISKRSKILNFKPLKIVVSATFNLIILKASLLLNLHTVLLMWVYDQRRMTNLFLLILDIFIFNTNILFSHFLYV